jgi:hypothetical protein
VSGGGGVNVGGSGGGVDVSDSSQSGVGINDSSEDVKMSFIANPSSALSSSSISQANFRAVSSSFASTTGGQETPSPFSDSIPSYSRASSAALSSTSSSSLL